MPAGATTVARALAAALAIVALMLVLAPSAMAKGCVDDILDDWSDDGRVDKTYSRECYDRTLEEMPRDLIYYSNAPDAVKAAKERVFRADRMPQGLPGNEGGAGGATSDGDDDSGPLSGLLNAGPSAADDLPLPLLILALVALVLMGAGAAGLVSRQLQARRAPADGPPPDSPGPV